MTLEAILYTLKRIQYKDWTFVVNSKMAINRARKWKANGDGTGYHIKDKEGEAR